MLVRNRLSRIYFLRRFFDYPIKLNLRTVVNLGPVRCVKAGASYAWSALFPRRAENSLEDFLVNRFGGELYRTFFKSYTEKVWGVPCTEISAEWGAQRIKGLSMTSAVLNALRRTVGAAPATARETQTSLIERFLYPRLGPGQLWEAVAERVRRGGGEIRLRHARRASRRDRRARHRGGRDRCGDGREVDARRRLRDLDDAGQATWWRASIRPRPPPWRASPRCCPIATSSPSASS